MKLSKEFYNGIIIFVGIGVYFLLMNALGLADVFFLRLLNVIFIFYGVNRTLQMNLAEGKKNFVSNAVSALLTSVIGVSLSVFGLLLYIYANGGDSYVQSLSKAFLFVGKPSAVTYCISLYIEALVSSVFVTFSLMLYWKRQYASD